MKTSAKIAVPLMLVPLFASAGLWAFQRDPDGAAKGGEAVGEHPLQLLADAGQFASGSGDGAAPAQQKARITVKKGAADRIGFGSLKLHRSLGKGGGPVAPDAPAASEPVVADRRPMEPESGKLALAAVSRLPEARTPIPNEAKSPDSITYAFGAGWAQMPRWMGSARRKNFAVPYININWRDQIEFSTTNGLIVDLIHGDRWHGGLVGTMMWGRSYADLGSLANRVPTLTNTLQGGAYLEYAFTKELSVGVRLRHDIQGTGAAYGDVYADLDLPSPGLIDHSVRVAAEAMNRAAMGRYFSVSADTAAALGTSAYQPRGGYSQLSVAYDLFVPTSQSTGVALAAGYGRLSKAATDSPLVRNFGSANQRNYMAAFVYHF